MRITKDEVRLYLESNGFTESEVLPSPYDKDEFNDEGVCTAYKWKPVLSEGYILEDDRLGVLLFVNPIKLLPEIALCLHRRWNLEVRPAHGSRPKALYLRR